MNTRQTYRHQVYYQNSQGHYQRRGRRPEQPETLVHRAEDSWSPVSPSGVEKREGAVGYSPADFGIWIDADLDRKVDSFEVEPLGEQAGKMSTSGNVGELVDQVTISPENGAWKVSELVEIFNINDYTPNCCSDKR